MSIPFYLVLVLCIPLYSAESQPPSEEYGSGANTVLDFYQREISPAKGGNRCPMHPSCSQYAKMAIAGNTASGMLKTFDRLMRCGQDAKTYQTHDKTGKLYDPVDVATRQLVCEGNVAWETEFILGIDFPASVSDTVSLFDFYLYHHRYDDALFLAFGNLYSPPEEDDHGTWLFETAGLLLTTGDYSGFLHLYHRYSGKSYLSPMDQVTFDLLLAKNFLLMNDYKKTLHALSLVDTSAGNNAARDELHFLSSLVSFYNGEIENAKVAASKISSSSCRSSFADHFLSIDTLIPSGRYRSPALAGALSTVLPGLGYAYAGRGKTAIAAAVINVLFIGTAVEAFRSKQYILGSTSAIIGSGWYFGNIYGSYSSAQKYNGVLKNFFLKQCNIKH